MHVFQGTSLRIVWCGAFSAAMFAALASGCSGDNGTGSTGDDASPDSTAADTAAPDTSSHDVTQTDTTVPGDAPSDVPVDAPVADASEAGGDAKSDARNDASSDGSNDAANDTASDGTGQNDAGEAGACVTTVALLGGGDGGVNDAGKAPVVLFSFDTSGSTDAGLDPNFSNFSQNGSTSTMDRTTTDGYPCAGALRLAVTYANFATTDQIYYNYQAANPQNWVGYTKLHAWMKVITTDYSTIQGVEPRIDSSNYTLNLFGGFVSGATFSDGGWHESVVPLTVGASYVPAAVNGFQYELQSTSAGVDGGPTAPPQATLLLDSIWLE